MLFIRQNLSGIVPTFTDGDVVQECNCTQPVAHTKFGLTAKGEWARGMKFIDSNLCNCDLPPDVLPNDCLTIHVVSEKSIRQRTDKDAVPPLSKVLAVDEVEATETEIRTVECADGSVTRQTTVSAETTNAKGEQTPGLRTATDANIILFPKSVAKVEAID